MNEKIHFIAVPLHNSFAHNNTFKLDSVFSPYRDTLNFLLNYFLEMDARLEGMHVLHVVVNLSSSSIQFRKVTQTTL